MSTESSAPKGWPPGLLDALEATRYWFDSVDQLGPTESGHLPNFSFEHGGLAHLLRFTRLGAYTAEQLETESARIGKMAQAGAALAEPVVASGQVGELAIRILDEKWRPQIFAAGSGGLGKALEWSPDDFLHCGQALGGAHSVGQELFGNVHPAPGDEWIQTALRSNTFSPECAALWKRIEAKGLQLSDPQAFVLGETICWLPRNGELLFTGMLNAGLGSQDIELGRVARQLFDQAGLIGAHGELGADTPELQSFLKGYRSRADRSGLDTDCLRLLMKLQFLLRDVRSPAG